MHDIRDYGAIDDGKTANQKAIQKAVDACHGNGGGVVAVPAGGAFVCGTVTLKSGVNLYLEPGSKLQASTREADYEPIRVAGEYGGNVGGCLLQAHQEKDISITGQGVIDGQSLAFMDGWWTEDGPYLHKPKEFRPRCIGFFGCSGIRLRDIRIQDAPQWTCHFTGCEDAVIEGITIKNRLDVPNCDGIDPDHCRNFRISNCHIEAGDDCIVLKTTREHAEYGPTENISISNCTLISTSAALKIGTESACDFRNITVQGCIIRRSHRGLTIQLRDEGNVEDVLFSDCLVETRLFCPRWWGRGEPIHVTAVPRNDKRPVGRVRNISFTNVEFTAENGVLIAGTPDRLLKEIRLSNVHGRMRKTSKWPAGEHDYRPTNGLEHSGLLPHDTRGFYAANVSDLTLDHCSVRWDDDAANAFISPKALETHNTPNLQVRAFHPPPSKG